MTCTIGYLEGVDPLILTKLYVKGHKTLPLSNFWDQHGKLVNLIQKGEVKAVIAYVHKIMPPIHEGRPTPYDMLQSCKIHEIPAFLIAPPDCEDDCVKLLGDEVMNFAILVTPETLEEELDKIL